MRPPATGPGCAGGALLKKIRAISPVASSTTTRYGAFRAIERARLGDRPRWTAERHLLAHLVCLGNRAAQPPVDPAGGDVKEQIDDPRRLALAHRRAGRSGARSWARRPARSSPGRIGVELWRDAGTSVDRRSLGMAGFRTQASYIPRQTEPGEAFARFRPKRRAQGFRPKACVAPPARSKETAS